MDAETVRVINTLLMGFCFLVLGGYFGLIQQRIGFMKFVPLTGELAQLWGGIMCVIGALLIFMALT